MESEELHLKKIIYNTIAILIVAIFLGACSDSDMVSEVNKTRELFGGRVNAENDTKTDEVSSNATELSKGDSKVGESYSWHNGAFSSELKAPSGSGILEAQVMNVVDGDTIDVKITNGAEERVRLILVNTPESKGKFKDDPQPFAIDAFEFTKQLIENQKIWLEKGTEERDKYGRLLAYVWLDNVVLNEEIETKEGELVLVGEKIGIKSLNELLLREGLAHVAIYPPNTQYVDEFEDIQKNAKTKNKGMWAE